LPRETDIEFPGRGEPGVTVTQLGQRLANSTNGVAHPSATYMSLAGSQAAFSVSVTEDLEEGYWVCILFQGGVKEVFAAAFFPAVKGVVSGIPAGGTDSQGKGIRNGAEVSLETVSGGSWASRHGGVIGNFLFNW